MIGNLMRAAELCANEYSDGHITLLRFTTHWKAFYGTVDMETGTGREFVRNQQGYTTLEEALIRLLRDAPQA